MYYGLEESREFWAFQWWYQNKETVPIQNTTLTKKPKPPKKHHTGWQQFSKENISNVKVKGEVFSFFFCTLIGRWWKTKWTVLWRVSKLYSSEINLLKVFYSLSFVNVEFINVLEAAQKARMTWWHQYSGTVILFSGSL